MERTFEKKMAELSTRCRTHIRSGQIALYAEDLKEIAGLFGQENRFRDQLKMLFLAFYIDLSGLGKASYIDHAAAEQMRAAADQTGMERGEVERFFFEVIHSDMVAQHPLSVRDSWYLANLCLDGKVEQADYILSKI